MFWAARVISLRHCRQNRHSLAAHLATPPPPRDRDARANMNTNQGCNLHLSRGVATRDLRATFGAKVAHFTRQADARQSSGRLRQMVAGEKFKINQNAGCNPASTRSSSAPIKVHFQFHVIGSKPQMSQCTMETSCLKSAVLKILLILFHLSCLLIALSSSQSSASRNATTGPNYFNRSDFHSWLLSRNGQSTSTEKPLRLAPPSHHRPNSGYAVEVAPPPSNQLLQYQIPKRNGVNEEHSQDLSPQSAPVAILSTNRSARTAVLAAATNYDDQPDGNDHNLLVSNTCDRDHMLVEIKTSEPFHGLVHTLNQRRKVLCTAEGSGGMLLRLSISHSLNPSDPQHCGVTRVANSKPEGRNGEPLSLIVAVRLNRNIELSEGKFFALNCTNHCARLDCSSGPPSASGKLINDLSTHSNVLRFLEREHLGDEADLFSAAGAGRFRSNSRNVERNAPPAHCSVWRFAWILALILCLAIILVGMLISNCIICMSIRQKEPNKGQQATRTNEKEASDLESQQVNSRERRDDRRKSRRKSRQIIYDNEDLNYATDFPGGPKRAGQSDFLALKKQHQEQLKRSQMTPTSRAGGETSREYR